MSIGSDLLRYNDEQLYMVPDTETCHLNLARDNWIWQFAWVIATNKRIISRHNYYVNWGFPLPVSKGAAMVTGFDQRVIDSQGESPEFVYECVNQYLRDPKYLKVSHNWLGFDSMVERFMAIQLGIKHDYGYLEQVIDTNCVARAIKKGIKPEKSSPREFKKWQMKLVSVHEKGLKTSLGFLLDEYKIEVDKRQLHRADYDVAKNWELWCKQMWEIEI